MCLLAQNMKSNILTMEAKEFRTTSCVTMHSPLRTHEIRVSLLGLWFNRICIEKDHELWDEGSPI